MERPMHRKYFMYHGRRYAAARAGEIISLHQLAWLGTCAWVRSWLESLLEDQPELHQVLLEAVREKTFAAVLTTTILADAASLYARYPDCASTMLAIIESSITSLSDSTLLDLFRECAGLPSRRTFKVRRCLSVDVLSGEGVASAERLLARLVARAFIVERPDLLSASARSDILQVHSGGKCGRRRRITG